MYSSLPDCLRNGALIAETLLTDRDLLTQHQDYGVDK